MKIWITITVNAEDLDWSGSSLNSWVENGQKLCDPDIIVKFMGKPVDDVDFDAAQTYLEEIENAV